MPDNRFWRNASGRLVFEMDRIPADSYRVICDAIVAKFRLTPHNDLVTNGHDICFQDYRRDEQIEGLKWDNWTGFTVVALTEGSESLIEDVAAWLQQSEWASI
jgi:hypothetical protein